MKIDKGFYPIKLFNNEFAARLKDVSPDTLSFALTRDGGYCEVYKTAVLPKGVDDALNFKYVERLIKTALWIVGGYKLSINCETSLYEKIAKAYKTGGLRDFDVKFFENVYGKPFTVEYVDKMPQKSRQLISAKKSDSGERIGFDAGGSDMKLAAVRRGEVIFSKEIIWQPKINSNPMYHVEHINAAFNEAASHLYGVDSIGVSSAGIFVNNETRVASLFLKVPEKDYAPIRTVYIDAAKRLGAPVTVANDGDVAAMAGAIEFKLSGVLGLAMGTSEAAGYVDKDNNLWGWLNELAFVPVDANESSMIDEWSGDYGTGVKYLSQDGVIKLAEIAGIKLENALTPAEKLKIVQNLVEKDDKEAKDVFSDVGTYLGWSIAYYYDFYKLENVLLMGRVASGRGGEIIAERAKEVLKENGLKNVRLLLPDEKQRRVGQAVAAAYLE